jgi:hypothetical protein
MIKLVILDPQKALLGKTGLRLVVSSIETMSTQRNITKQGSNLVFCLDQGGVDDHRVKARVPNHGDVVRVDNTRAILSLNDQLLFRSGEGKEATSGMRGR